ncbi:MULTISPECIES: GNAT family N-acetyltransferase [Cryobacterium]|uniref:GNAT family N-acetyltransferase n=1 Tax=Cryobacterium TaxID=69578 RepID=UPI0008D678DB|nr:MULTISPECIES: GNAT family N-acetyltransferase [Cryobacterium]SEM70468.1 Acetyltransferase (GNAT) family protein [Cryobacterium luteum]
MKCVSVRLGDPEVAPLLLDLHHEYETRYGDGDSVHDVDGAEFDPPFGGFLVLVDGDTTVAGGGLHQFSATTAEVKRMWTNPDYRRQGHAKTILRELEHLARSLGYERLRLETGYAQPEALALYRSLGFTEIGNYGIYEHASGFELDLTR